MSSTTNTNTVARLLMPAAVLALLLALALSAVASARPTYDKSPARHRAAKSHKHAKKHAKKRARSAASAITIALCAKSGTTTPAGSPAPVPVWSFVDGGCSSPDSARAVAPTLTAGEGDAVTINVENQLPEALSLDIPGITLNPGSRDVPAGGTGSISFTASAPGTYLYESSANGGRQAEVGLAGAFVVTGNGAHQAYDDSDGRSAFDSSHVMVLSEIDPALNAAAGAGTLGSFNMGDWAPTFHLINGDVYDVSTPAMHAGAGDKVLLRWVNVGSEQATMTMLGLDSTLIASSAQLLGTPAGDIATTFPAGSTADAIVTVPAGASAGDRFAIYDRHLALVNGSSGDAPGGRIRFIEVP